MATKLYKYLRSDDLRFSFGGTDYFINNEKPAELPDCLYVKALEAQGFVQEIVKPKKSDK
jgi:hypothetical protein